MLQRLNANCQRPTVTRKVLDRQHFHSAPTPKLRTLNALKPQTPTPQVSDEGHFQGIDCWIGGTGEVLDKRAGERGVAHMGVNALMNARVLLRRCLLQDIGQP